MTKLLEKAFKTASKLPEIEQNTIAKWMLSELESGKKWEKIFAESEDILDKLAGEALEADSKEKTKRLNIDEL